MSAANKLIIHIGLPKAASTSWQTTVLMKLQHPNVIYGGRLPTFIFGITQLDRRSALFKQLYRLQGNPRFSANVRSLS